MRELVELRSQFADLEPILILGPTTRGGSTLLQRAINQKEQAIVYGENFIFVENLPYVVGGVNENLEGKVRSTGAALAAFLSGDKGMDATTLFPDYTAYRTLLWRFFFDLAAFYRDQAQRSGYSRWGLKHQVTNLRGFHAFLRLIPKVRAVTVFRDVVAVAKSMYTRWPENLETEQQCFEIGRSWRVHLDYLLKLDRRSNLVVRYEDLVENAEPVIARIEKHLALELSRDAFAKRINTNTFDPATGKIGETYRAPSELAAEKLLALLKGAEPLYGRLGYRPPQFAA